MNDKGDSLHLIFNFDENGLYQKAMPSRIEFSKDKAEILKDTSFKMQRNDP